MSVEITVEPAPTTPEITVNPAGEVTCTVTYSTLTGSINNPGGSNGDVQVKSGVGFAGISPGAAGQVLTSTGTAWESAPPDGIPDGDKGDITVSGGGAIWTIDNGAVTLAKQANMATASVVYRKTAGSGAPEVNTLATLKTDLGLTGTNSGDQTITLTGDVTGSGTGSFAATLANTTVVPASYTAANITVDAKGRITAAASGSSTTPGGTDTQVQFNDGGAFGGDAGLTYAKSTDTLTGVNQTFTGLSTLTHIHGNIAGSIYVHVKNDSGVTLAKGTPVYATGSVGSSGEILVAAADSTNTAKMPCIGIIDSELIANAEGNAVVVGEVFGLATNSYAINDELFVSTGTLTKTRPTTGEAQSVAVVSRAHASTGIIVVNTQQRLNSALTILANSSIADPNADRIMFWDDSAGQFAFLTAGTGLSISGTTLTGGISALTGDVTASGTGSVTATIANDAVTYAKLQNVSAASVLLGRGSASGSGDAQEITLGTGLSMSGTTLNASSGNPFDQNLNTTDAVTFTDLTLTNGVINSQAATLNYNFYDVVDSTAVPYIAVNLYDDSGPPHSLIGSSLFGFRGDGTGSGHQFLQGSTNEFVFEGIGGSGFANVSANSFSGGGSNLTALNAGNISSGTLGVARGGTGATTLTANNVLLGNGTSALQVVAPSTSGNVLTSNGTTWTSAAAVVRNPAGTGSELQFRSSDTAFGAVTGSTVSGGTITLADKLTITQATANASVLTSTGYSLTGTNASSMIDLAGTWNTTGAPAAIKLDITDTASNGSSMLMHLTVGGANRFRLFKDGGLFCAATVNGTTINASNYFGGGDSGQFILGGSLDTRLQRDAAAVWAMRNGANAHTLRIYEVDSGANDEYLEISAASGTNLIRPQATGTGTASVVRYHTTTAVFWTSGSGSPESVVTAPVGSMYTDTAGGAATTLYVKESGTGSTGWIAK